MHLDNSVLNSEQKGFSQIFSCLIKALHPKVPLSFWSFSPETVDNFAILSLPPWAVIEQRLECQLQDAHSQTTAGCCIQGNHEQKCSLPPPAQAGSMSKCRPQASGFSLDLKQISLSSLRAEILPGPTAGDRDSHSLHRFRSGFIDGSQLYWSYSSIQIWSRLKHLNNKQNVEWY